MKISVDSIKKSFKKGVDFVKGDLRTYWNKPHEGEFLSYKQMIRFCVGAMGINVFTLSQSLISFGFNYFCGSIFGLKLEDFTMIGIIGTILGYVFLWMSPVGMLMYENHGRLGKKEKWMLNGYSIFRLAVGIPLFFVDPYKFEKIMVGFPQILGSIFVLGAVFEYLNWAIRYYLCPKYGRVKPFIVVGAIPAAICYSIIPWLPIESLSYVEKLIILYISFYIAGWFGGNFTNYGGMINFMTQNTQERQRLLSWAPIVTGFIRSIIKLILPTLITSLTISGHVLMGYEDIWVYRYFVPAFCILSVICGAAFLPVKENLVEQKVDRPKVQFIKGARQVFKNKYLWITTVSGFLAGFCLISTSVVNWWMIYKIRNAWALGLVTGLITFSSVGANIITPILTKHFEKQKIYVWGRVIMVFFTPLYFLLYKLDMFWLYVAASFINNIGTTIINGIGGGLNGDIMDYHQWKFGERCDSVSGVIGWIFSPFTTVLSYVAPYVYRTLGYYSDYGVLYDNDILEKFFNYSFIFGAIGGVLSVIPFFFYDLTAEKHRKCVQEIKERVLNADIAAFIKRVKNGTDAELDESVIQKLADEGVDVAALRREYSPENLPEIMEAI